MSLTLFKIQDSRFKIKIKIWMEFIARFEEADVSNLTKINVKVKIKLQDSRFKIQDLKRPMSLTLPRYSMIGAT